MIESDPCCFQVSIACEPEKPEDEDCRGNLYVFFLFFFFSFLKLQVISFGIESLVTSKGVIMYKHGYIF